MHLTPAGLEAVGAYGVTTIIDLRSPAELKSSPNPFAGRAAAGRPAFLSVPLVDDAGIVRLGEASGMFERYLIMLDQRAGAFRRVFDAVAEADGGVVFHCFAGKDRTGLVAAMLLSLAGVADDDIAADFAETDAQLADRYEEWIAAAPFERRREMRDELRCPPDRILGVLAHLLDRWGGVPGYLEATGLTPTNIDRLGAKLS